MSETFFKTDTGRFCIGARCIFLPENLFLNFDLSSRLPDFFSVPSRFFSAPFLSNCFGLNFLFILVCKIFTIFCPKLEKYVSLKLMQNGLSKQIRKVEQRFPNYTEIDEAKGKRDQTKQEIFLNENSVALDKLPLEELNQNWLKKSRFIKKKWKESCKNDKFSSHTTFFRNQMNHLLNF